MKNFLYLIMIIFFLYSHFLCNTNKNNKNKEQVKLTKTEISNSEINNYNTASFRKFLINLKIVLNEKKFGVLYDYFSPARVRAKLSKKEFLLKSEKIFSKDKLQLYSAVLNIIYLYKIKNKKNKNLKVISDKNKNKIYKITLNKQLYTFVANKEKENWVLEDLF